VQLSICHPGHGEKMKTCKAICAASVIALSLSVPVYAVDPPPPPPPPADQHIPGQPITAEGGSETTPPPGTTSIGGDISLATLADMLRVLGLIY
jgi:hypothetical protein